MKRLFTLVLAVFLAIGLYAQVEKAPASKRSEGVKMIKPLHFNTLSSQKLDVIFSESFDNGEIPDTWTQIQMDDENYGWTASSYGYVYHYFTSSDVHADDWLITPAIYFEDSVDVYLQYYEAGYYISYAELHQVLVLDYVSEDSVHVIDTITEQLPTTSGVWEFAEFNISQYHGDTIYIAYRYTGADADIWFLDEVKVVKKQPQDIALIYLYVPSMYNLVGDTIVPTAYIKNVGNDTIAGVQVVFNDNTGWADTVEYNDSIPMNQIVLIADSNGWVVNEKGFYDLTATVLLADDPDLTNNSMTVDSIYFTDTIIPMVNNDTIDGVCSGLFTDAGGVSGNYNNDENNIVVIYSTDSTMPMLTFFEYSIETGYDNLYIYNGADTTAPLLVTLTGYGKNVVVKGVNPDHALTLWFKSDGSVTRDGWVAEIGCYVPPQNDLQITDVWPKTYSFYRTFDSIRPYMVIYNSGVNTQAGFTVEVNDDYFYSASVVVNDSLPMGQFDTVYFDVWMPPTPGVVNMTYKIDLEGDENLDDNTVNVGVNVVKYELVNKFNTYNGYMAGLGTDMQRIFVTNWWYSIQEVYTMSGDSLFVGDIAPSRIRDLAFDGQYMYGGAADNIFYAYTPTDTGLQVVDTFNLPTDVEVRAIAYDTVDKAFWVHDWGADIYQVDTAGNVLDTVILDSVGIDFEWYGMAMTYNNDKKCLWLGTISYYNDNDEEFNGVIKFDLTNGQLTNDMVPVAAFPGVAPSYSVGGVDQYVDDMGNLHILMDIQTDPNIVADVIVAKPLYDVTFYVVSGETPLSNATIEIGDTTLTTDDNGIATMQMTAGTYTAIASRDLYATDTVEFTVPDVLTVKFDLTYTNVDAVPSITVAPNPSNGQFTVYNAAGYQATITDISGRVIYSGPVVSNAQRFDINLSAGVYLIHLQKDNDMQTLKVIVR